jgi:exodeoxyribonuclease-3
MVKIASFNVNSVRARLPVILEWLKHTKPDVVLMQETKCEDHSFPALEFEDMGYNLKIHGQKSYNGVAILSKEYLDDVKIGLFDDHQARYLDAFTCGVRVINIYSPNGNPIGTDKFQYKLQWLEKLRERIHALMKNDEPMIIAGDFNVVRRDDMVYSAKAFADDAIMQPESRAAFEKIMDLGLISAAERFGKEREYTYYGYRGGGRPKGNGIVLDYFLANPAAAKMLKAYGIDEFTRDLPRSSDHLPVWVEC